MHHADKLNLAINAAKSAGKLLQSYAGTAAVSQKSTQNLVTEADIAAERLIADMINDRFPDHQLLGEEGIADGGDNSESMWIIDPLDGTNNYAHGIPQFCVSIAYYEHHKPQVAVVFDPNRDELFQAVLGAGAMLNGKPISTSSGSHLAESIIATGFHYDRGPLIAQTLKAIETLFAHQLRGIRRFGSAALDLAWVACGRMEGFFEYKLSPWDYAAGILLVTEAGGECFDRSGAPCTIDSNCALATNGKISNEFLNCVKWSGD